LFVLHIAALKTMSDKGHFISDINLEL